MTGYCSCAKRAQRGSDAFERRPHIYHHDEYFAGIQNLQLIGLVERRGQLRAEAMHIDLQRLWMHRFNEYLLRIMKTYGRSVPGVRREKL